MHNARFLTTGRRGQVEVQFNWIFVLIVGAILLSFFVTIALRQKEASEQGITIDFFVNFEKALSGIAASKGKILLYDVPKMELRYDCVSGCDCAAYAGSSRARATVAPFEMKDKIIFSPNHLKGNSLLTWSKEWTYPYRIANFVLITSPEVKYLIEDDEAGRGARLYELLPPQKIEKDLIEQTAFDKSLFIIDEPITGVEGNYKVRYVFSQQNPEEYVIPTALLSLPNSDVTAVKIELSPQESTGTVTFYQKSGTTTGATFRKIGDSYLFGEATVVASVFSEDLNSYACMMNRAFKRFELVSKLYSEKQNYYSDVLDCKLVGDNSCCISYDNLALSSLISSISSFDFLQQGNPEKASAMIQYISSFRAQNLEALQSSCPHIY